MDRLFTFIIFVSFLSYCEPWFFDGIVDHGNVERCPQRIPRDNYLFALNDTCIELIHDEHSWYDSRRYCTQHHGDLVMIQDMAKQQFIMKALQTAGWDRKGIWIGGTDREKEGHWKWVNGQKMTWGNWKRGQGPGNSGFLFSSGQWEDCAVIRKDDGYKWHDYACNLPQYHYGSICEYNFISTTPKSTTMMPKTTSISVGTFQSTTVTTSRSTTILSTTTPTKTTAISTKQKPTTTPRTTPATTIHPSSTPTLTTWPRKTTDSTTTHVSSTMSTTMPSITTPASTTLISTTTLPTTQTSTTHVPTTQTSTTALSATQTSTTPAPTTQTSTTKLSTTQTSTTTLPTTQSTKTPAQITNLVTTSSTSLKTTTPVPSIYVSSTLTTKVSSTKLTTTQSPVSASTTQETSPSAKSIQTMLTMKAKSTLSPTHMPTMRPTRGALTTIQGIGEKTARPNIPLTTQLVNNEGGLLRRSDTGQKSTHKSSTGYIIGGVCVAIVVAGIIVAVFVVRRRRISLSDTNGKVHGAENPMYSVMYDDTSIPPVGADIQINDIYEPTKYFTNGESMS